MSTSREPASRPAARVSVVITTRNSAPTVEHLFRSIEQQTVPAEVIVVDNSSSDDTLELAAQHPDVVRSAGPERSAQRNLGTAVATTEYVLHVDSDMVLEPQTIADGQLDDAIVAVLVLRSLLRAGGEPSVRSHWPGPESSLRVLLRLARA